MTRKSILSVFPKVRELKQIHNMLSIPSRRKWDDCSSNYGDMSKDSYWEMRYKQQAGRGESFEWLSSYSHLREVLLPMLPTRPFTLLDVGCGLSTLSIDLCQDAVQSCHLFCVDISQDALKILNEIHIKTTMSKTPPRTCFIRANILHLPFLTNSMDIILDKGTIDSLLKDPDRNQAAERYRILVLECLRVLVPDGCLIQVSDEDPELRLELLHSMFSMESHSQLQVSYKMVEVDENNRYNFVYTIKKRKKSFVIKAFP